MVETARYDIELAGCTPEPLMAYLKALGILRLVSEQKDAEARGWWNNDIFCLRSSLDRDALVKFFLEDQTDADRRTVERRVRLLSQMG